MVTRVTTPITSSSRICPARQAAAWAAESPTQPASARGNGEKKAANRSLTHTESAAARLVSAVTSLPASPPPLLWSKSPHRSGHHSIRVSSTPSRSAPPCSARRRCTPSYRGPRAGSSAAAGPPRPRRRTCKSPAPRPAPQPRFVSLSLLCFSGVCSSPPRCVSSAIGVGCSEDRRGLGAGGMIT